MASKIFLDTNVVIDALGEREPFNHAARQIFSLSDLGRIKVAVSALTFSTTEYVLSRFLPKEMLYNRLRLFKSMCEIVPLDNKILDQALAGPIKDFEDCIQFHSAVRAKCDLIITRDESDFEGSSLALLHPDNFIKLFI